MKKYFLIIGFFLSFSCCAKATEIIPVALFSKGDLNHWESKHFRGQTNYTIEQIDKQKIIHAESDNSASVIIKKIKINLKQYPYLNWRWKIKNRLHPINEKIKEGHDFAARVCVLIDNKLIPLRKKSLEYTWTSHTPKDNIWPHAFALKNSIMMSIRCSKQDKINTWYTEKRNVYEDLKRCFAKKIKYIHGIALMTDSDNTHTHAEAYYGDIFFSAT